MDNTSLLLMVVTSVFTFSWRARSQNGGATSAKPNVCSRPSAHLAKQSRQARRAAERKKGPSPCPPLARTSKGFPSAARRSRASKSRRRAQPPVRRPGPAAGRADPPCGTTCTGCESAPSAACTWRRTARPACRRAAGSCSLDAGAGHISFATVFQAAVGARHGVPVLLIANQVVQRAGAGRAGAWRRTPRLRS